MQRQFLEMQEAMRREQLAQNMASQQQLAALQRAVNPDVLMPETLPLGSLPGSKAAQNAQSFLSQQRMQDAMNIENAASLAVPQSPMQPGQTGAASSSLATLQEYEIHSGGPAMQSPSVPVSDL